MWRDYWGGGTKQLPFHFIPQVVSVHCTNYLITRKTLPLMHSFMHSLLLLCVTATFLSSTTAKLPPRMRRLVSPCKIFQLTFPADQLSPELKGNLLHPGHIYYSHKRMSQCSQASPCRLFLQGHREENLYNIAKLNFTALHTVFDIPLT